MFRIFEFSDIRADRIISGMRSSQLVAPCGQKLVELEHEEEKNFFFARML